MKKQIFISAFLLLLTGWSSSYAEDGSRLWLRFDNVSKPATITGVKGTAMTELQTYWKGGPVLLKRKKGLTNDSYTITSQKGKTVISEANDAGVRLNG